MFSDDLVTWLSSGVLPKKNRNLLIDVGAYIGDFTKICLKTGLSKKAHLFEPNPENFQKLAASFKNAKNVFLHKMAAGKENCKCKFRCDPDLSTGSILSYAKSKSISLTTHLVKQQTLDCWWEKNNRPSVGLLKSDTQGNDLNVMRGAESLISNCRPWIIIEVIFSPLYIHQAEPHEIFNFFHEKSFSFAGMFNEHREPNGIIAFADLVFSPKKNSKIKNKFVGRPKIEDLLNENKSLREICEERLNLINQLHISHQKKHAIKIKDTKNQKLRKVYDRFCIILKNKIHGFIYGS